MSDYSVKDTARHEIRCLLEDMARCPVGEEITGSFSVSTARYSTAELTEGLRALADELRGLDVIA